MGLLDKLSVWLGGGGTEATVLVLGLDNSGKSTMLHALKPAEQRAPLAPTVAQQRDHFQSGGVSFSAWDVSGAARMRPLWERHYRDTDAVIFVVDSADHLRLGNGFNPFTAHYWARVFPYRRGGLEHTPPRGSNADWWRVVAREELELMLAHPAMAARRLPLLVLANKCDAPHALAATHVAAALGLERIVDKPWHICSSSGLSGAGLADGVAWLARQLREQKTKR